MSSIDRISAAFLTNRNEINFALANLNFDFSLVKVNTPPEYATLGTALTRRRQAEAESGPTHQTARKLGALFESIMPNIPLLVSAYGKRATEIMEKPGTNPTGNAKQHGPFVGADATCIWAAATSGLQTIAIHLLACLLVRAFDNLTISISIWAELVAELVAERQRELRDSLGNTSDIDLVQLAAANAESQRISREELRQWDASARAWLQNADAAMAREHHQCRFIVNNINPAVNRSPTLYPCLTVLGSTVKAIDTSDALMKTVGVATTGCLY